MPARRSPLFGLWLWGPVVAQMFLIFRASSIPNLQELPGRIPDWLGHGIGYAILGVLLLRAIAGGRRAGATWTAAAWALAFAMLYGVSDEWHQAFVPGRSPALNDVGADTIGALVAVVAGRVWSARRRV
jgi:VanZ family protein